MPDYETTLSTPIRLGDALPADHLARFVVDIISQLDLSKIYAGYAETVILNMTMSLRGALGFAEAVSC